VRYGVFQRGTGGRTGCPGAAWHLAIRVFASGLALILGLGLLGMLGLGGAAFAADAAVGGGALPVPALAPASASEAFDAAARLYEQGRPLEAAEAYERLLASGVMTASVHFNQGNAWLQGGRVGRAIVSYRRALQLAPRDAEVAANLARARARVGGGAGWVDTSGARWVRLLHPDEWAGLALVLVWVWMGWLVVREAVPRLRPAVPGLALGLGFAAVVVGGLAWGSGSLASRSMVVVIGGDVAARFGPLEESQTAFTLPDGAELRVSDVKGEWREVRDAAGRRGWVMARNVVPVP
jgi:hypothetical protein